MVRCDEQNRPLLHKSASPTDTLVPLVDANESNSNGNGSVATVHGLSVSADVRFTCGPADDQQQDIRRTDDEDDDVFVTSSGDSSTQ